MWNLLPRDAELEELTSASEMTQWAEPQPRLAAEGVWSGTMTQTDVSCVAVCYIAHLCVSRSGKEPGDSGARVIVTVRL